MKESLEDREIAKRMEELKQLQPTGTMSALETEIYSKLAADFPREAMTADKSRGFALTSIKAQYVTERLNDVLGFMNWTHGGEFQRVDEGVLYLGTLVITVDGRQNRQFAPGFAKITDGKNLGDAYKSAKTDSLSKAASLIGVGNSVFKGMVDANSLGASTSAAPTARAKKAAAATNVASDMEQGPATEDSNVTNLESAKKPAGFKTRRAKAASASEDEI